MSRLEHRHVKQAKYVNFRFIQITERLLQDTTQIQEILLAA